jgi:predicted RNase H-like HicB family nuclease
LVIEYMVVLLESEEGFPVGCPTLRGCHSQSTTMEEAVANM